MIDLVVSSLQNDTFEPKYMYNVKSQCSISVSDRCNYIMPYNYHNIRICLASIVANYSNLDNSLINQF